MKKDYHVDIRDFKETVRRCHEHLCTNKFEIFDGIDKYLENCLTN